MSVDIDAQVAAFAAEMEGAGVVDLEQTVTDVTAVAFAMLTAPTHHRAALALGDWFSRRPADAYTVAVARAAMSAVGSHVALSHPTALAGPDGLLGRLFRLSEALQALTPGGIQ